jgi:lysophospholipase L1-like esterase
MSRSRSIGLTYLVLLALFFIQIGALAAQQTKQAEKKPRPKRGAGDPKETVTPVPRDKDPKWVERQEQINANVKKGGAQLLFIGDSITQGWEGPGKEVWEKYYGKRHAVNLGIGGDRTQHVLWRLDHGNLDGIRPKLAVLMIGTNNSRNNTSEQIADGVKAIVEKLRTKLPRTKILILGIFPRGKDSSDPKRKVNEGVNSLIAQVEDGKNVFFLDIGNRFLSANGKLTTDAMTPDLVHLNPKGYEIWAESTEPMIKKLMGESE